MNRKRRGSSQLKGRISCLVLSLSITVLAAAQQPRPNPLRSSAPSASKPSQSVAAASFSSSADAAVGTSVRQDAAAPTARVSDVAPRQPATPRPAAAQRPSTAQRSPAVQRPVRDPAVVQAAYGQRVMRSPTHSHSPGPIHAGPGTTSVLHGTVKAQGPVSEIVEGEIIGGEIIGGEMIGEYGGEFGGEFIDGGMHPSCGGCGNCNQCCLPLPRIPLDNLTIFGGVHGFTGPMNRGQTGSFGFHEGFNWGAPVPCWGDCLSMQAGARFTQSNFSGAEFSPDSRGQVFLTGGLFRRVDWGLQLGVAFDYLSDDWYAETDLYQLRPEIAWVFPCGHELGFWFTASTNEDTAVSRVFTTPVVSANVEETWEATDLYAFYYRHRFSQWEGATARGYAGFTGASDGLIGADLHIPLGCDFALEAGFTYLIPEEDKGPVGIGNEEESWNVAVTLVWYPCSGRAMARSYSTPLFSVADNGSFMVDQVR